jgi:hypothetical protein
VNGASCNLKENLEGKIILITGTSAGIGTNNYFKLRL